MYNYRASYWETMCSDSNVKINKMINDNLSPKDLFNELNKMDIEDCKNGFEMDLTKETICKLFEHFEENTDLTMDEISDIYQKEFSNR